MTLANINPYFNGFLRLKSWGPTSILELANMSGTWPRCHPLNLHGPSLHPNL